MEEVLSRLSAIEKNMSALLFAGKEVLTAEEAAAFIGVTKGSLYHLTSSQKIPHYKPTGKTCYFKRTELEVWALRNRVSTHEELEMQAQSHCMKHKSKSI